VGTGIDLRRAAIKPEYVLSLNSIEIRGLQMFTVEHITLAFVTMVAAFVLGVFVYVSRDRNGRLSIDRTMLVMLLVPILSTMAIFAIVLYVVG
jgi:ABC-type proline/glycine betaine transport system permease subunit